MADLAIVIDTSSIADAKKKVAAFQAQLGNNKSVLGLTSALGTVESGVKQLVAAQAKGQISSRTYQQGLLEQKRALMALGLSSQLASARVQQLANELRNQSAAKAAAAALEQAARASKALADRQRELRMRFQEGYAHFAGQRKAMRDLREAYRSGIITLEQYKAQLLSIRNASSTLTLAQQAQTAGMSRTGVAVQQVGYQVGDFAVQIQGGTNAFVAFGQQATQLVGILPLIHTQLGLTMGAAIGLSAGLGIIIPIATAVGAAVTRASGSTKTLSQRFTDLDTVAGRLSTSFDQLEDKELAHKFGNLSSTVKNLTSNMVSLDNSVALKGLLAGLQAVNKEASAGFFRQVGEGGLNILRFVDPSTSMKDSDQVNLETYNKLGLQMARSQYLSYVEEMKTLAESGDVDGVVSKFNTFLDDATDSGKAVGEITSSGAELANVLYQSMTTLAAMTAKFDGSAESSKRLTEQEEIRLVSIGLFYDLQQKTTEETFATLSGVNAIKDAVAATTKTLENRLEISKLTLQFGKDSEEVANKEAEIARASYILAQQDNKVKGNNLIAAMKLYDAAVLNEKAIAAAAAESKELEGGLKGAAAAMQSLVGFGQGLEKALLLL